MASVEPTKTIDYIKNTHYKESYADSGDAIKWRKGFDLIFDGYLFQTCRHNKPDNIEHSHNWRCINKLKCKASVTITIHSNKIIRDEPHTSPECQRITKLQIDVKNMEANTINQVQQENVYF